MNRTVATLLCSLIFGLALFGPAALTAQRALAQDEPKAAAADHGGGDVEKKPEQKGGLTIWWIVYSSGVIGFFLLLLSFYFVALIIRLFMEMRQDLACPPDEVQACEQLLASRDYQGIYDYLRNSNSLFARLVCTGLVELPAGLKEARELMDRQLEAETVEMESKISMLAVLGTLGPMIGLVGTLTGMIASFAVIATSDQQMKASAVAEGISEALLLTFEGVALSVPAIYFYAVFRNRVQSITVETLLQADSFVRRVAAAAKSPKSAVASAR
jgi:biopolymer transport protein ExbB